MTSHEWFIEHRTAFVIRTLEPDEERSFREHLAGCAECRAEVERSERELAWLPMGVAPVTPRPGLTRSLVDGALGARRRSPGWLVPVSLAASLLLAVGSWFWAWSTVRGFEDSVSVERERLGRELAMTRDTLGIIRQAGMVRHADITMGEHKGGLIIFADTETHRWNVMVYGLPAPLPGQVCQFWFITDSGMVKSVPVQTQMGAPAFVTLGMPSAPGKVMGAALTMESEGSSNPAPQGPQLVHLML
ncbi:MAG: anti-sigma factor [Gemmatimonadota bacterium]